MLRHCMCCMLVQAGDATVSHPAAMLTAPHLPPRPPATASTRPQGDFVLVRASVPERGHSDVEADSIGVNRDILYIPPHDPPDLGACGQER